MIFFLSHREHREKFKESSLFKELCPPDADRFRGSDGELDFFLSQCPLWRILKINNFDLRVAYIRELGVLDKMDHLIQRGINPLPIIPNRTNPQHRLLPKILTFHLRNSDVKAFPYALHDAAENLALSLQRKIFMEKKLQLAYADDHFPPRLYNCAVTFSTTYASMMSLTWKSLNPPTVIPQSNPEATSLASSFRRFREEISPS